MIGMWHISMKWRGPDTRAAALATQFEDLLHEVWDCERWWRLQDRIDLAASLVPVRQRAVRRRDLP